MAQGKRIREARHRLKLTQIGLADRIGVHQSSVAYWESGKTRPRSATMLTLALALDVAPEWLEFGSTFGASDAQIPVVGALLRGAVRRPKESAAAGSIESVSAGLDGSGMVAVRVSDTSLEPAYCKGDVGMGPLLSGGEMTRAAGRDSVVQFWDGRFTLKRIGCEPTDQGVGSNPDQIVDLKELQEIAWCMPVEWIRRPSPEARVVPENQASKPTEIAEERQRDLEAVT